jgi:anti-sigma factor RsiW
MNDPFHLNEAEREELVAFLDGELPEEEAHQVEAKLNRDASTRAEADALRKAWDLLDYLPKPEPSSNFTHRTLERLGAVRQTQTVPGRRLRIVAVGLAWVAAVLLAVGIGYGAMALFLTRNAGDKDLVRDLRVLENKRLYDVGEDLDFLRELDQPDLFGDAPQGS